MISGLKFHGPPEELLMERISIVMKCKKILLFFCPLYSFSTAMFLHAESLHRPQIYLTTQHCVNHMMH